MVVRLRVELGDDVVRDDVQVVRGRRVVEKLVNVNVLFFFPLVVLDFCELDFAQFGEIPVLRLVVPVVELKRFASTTSLVNGATGWNTYQFARTVFELPLRIEALLLEYS